MNMFKRLLSTALIAVMLAGSIPFESRAAEPETISVAMETSEESIEEITSEDITVVESESETETVHETESETETLSILPTVSTESVYDANLVKAIHIRNKWIELYKDAKEELENITSSKDVFGVVYLADSYDLREDANEKSRKVVTLYSGQTVFINSIGVDADLTPFEEVEQETYTVESVSEEITTEESETDSDVIGETETATESETVTGTVVDTNFSDDIKGYDDLTDEDIEDARFYLRNVQKVMFYVTAYVGETEYRGYIDPKNIACSDELLLQWKEKYAALFTIPGAPSRLMGIDYSDVNKFPISYQVKLRALKSKHPNWIFVPMNTGMNWSDCVTKQLGWSGGSPYSEVASSAPAAYKGQSMGSGWYAATRPAVEYYMDPRNFMGDQSIFMFEQEAFNESYHTVSALTSFLSGTYFGGVAENGLTYAQIIFNTGKAQKISPFYLASRIISEQGASGSQMVYGTYSGYQGYFNHFNVGASGTGTTALVNGLSYAKSHGWNTRQKSIEGGAATYGNGYIKKGQDTIYLQKFDLVTGRMHQYMQALHAPYNDALSMHKLYSQTNSVDSAFVFKIPVYNNMPNSGVSYSLSPTTITMKKGETKQVTLKANGQDITTKLNDGNFRDWNQGDEDIAKVNGSGLITATGAGTTVIRLTVDKGDPDYKATFNINVAVEDPITNIDYKHDSMLLYSPDSASGSTEPTEGVVSIVENPIANSDSYVPQWSISDPNVATITPSADGKSATVTAKQGGLAEITVKATIPKSTYAKARTIYPYEADGKTIKTIKLYVRKPLRSLAVTPTTANLNAGEKQKLRITYSPLDTTDSLDMIWTSSDSNKAEVVNDCIVAKSTGTVTLTGTINEPLSEYYLGGTDTKATDDITTTSCTTTISNYRLTFNDTSDNNVYSPITNYASMPLGYGVPMAESVAAGDSVWNQSDHVDGTGKVSANFMGWYTEKGGRGRLITADTIVTQTLLEGIASGGTLNLYSYYEPASEEQEMAVKPLGTYEYTGYAICPEVKVYSNGRLLTEGVDYDLKYKNNVEIAALPADPNNPSFLESLSCPRVVVIGRGEYADVDSITSYFAIVGKNIADSDVTIEDFEIEYDGKAKKYAPVVKWGNDTLKYRRDYTVTYIETGDDAYKELGTYAVKVEGKGNYTGEKYYYITITKHIMIDNVTLTYGDAKSGYNSYYKTAYTGNAIMPKISASYKGRVLSILPIGDTSGKKADIVYSFENNVSAGTADIILEGTTDGNVRGKRTEHFTISGTDIKNMTISGIANQTYSGEPVYIDGYMLRDKSRGNAVLTEGVDYYVVYTNNKMPGVASITFVGMGRYSGSVMRGFTIYDNRLSERTVISGITSQYYSSYIAGGIHTTYVLRDKLENNRLMTEGVDYTVGYANNTSVGRATVIFTGIGKYRGTIAVDFDIIDPNDSDSKTEFYTQYGNEIIGLFGGVVGAGTKGGQLTQPEKEYADSSYEATVAGNTSDMRLVESIMKSSDESAVMIRNELAGKKVLCIGDSNTEIWGGLTEQTVYSGVLNQTLGCTVINCGEGGRTYTGEMPLADAAALTNVERMYMSIGPDVDVITIEAGVNDSYVGNKSPLGRPGDGNSHTFCGALANYISALKAKWPSAKIVICTPARTSSVTTYKLSGQRALDEYVNAMLAVAKNTGCEVIDYYGSNLLNSYDSNVYKAYMRDDVHMNINGQRVYGQHMAAELLKIMGYVE